MICGKGSIMLLCAFPFLDFTRHNTDICISRSWGTIASEAQKLKSRHRVARLFTTERDSKKVNDLVQMFSDSIEEFQVKYLNRALRLLP